CATESCSRSRAAPSSESPGFVLSSTYAAADIANFCSFLEPALSGTASPIHRSLTRETSMNEFKLTSSYDMRGDQPKAVDQLVDGVERGDRFQTLLGATGTGKTFSAANVIQRVQRPALVIAHNKTLAAQLCAEFRDFFPENAVEYFVSYYDYYQPEAYIPQTDTY